MIDVTKASRETLEGAAESVLEWAGSLKTDAILSPNLRDAVAKLRAECAPKLRSRAAVDAEIVRTVRENVRLGSDEDCLTLTSSPRFRDPANTIRRLCAEPTAEEPDELDLAELQCEDCMLLKREESSVCTRNMLSNAVLCNSCAGMRMQQKIDRERASEPDELQLNEHEVCSCEEAEKLKARVAELENAMRIACRAVTPYWSDAPHVVRMLRKTLGDPMTMEEERYCAIHPQMLSHEVREALK